MRQKYIYSPSSLCAVLIAIFLYTGILPIHDRHAFTSLLNVSSVTSIEGVIKSNPTKTSSGMYYLCILDCLEVSSKGFISEAKGSVQVLIPTEIVEALYPGALYSNYKASATIIEKGVILQTSVRYIPQKNKTINKPTYIVDTVYTIGWVNTLSYFRALCRLEFKRLLYVWGEAGGLLLALLSGSREYTNSALQDAFRRAGLSHILALSGMHLSLFAGLSKGVFSFLGGKKLGTLCSFFAIIIFVWFAGLSPSLLRALLCSLLVLLLDFTPISVSSSIILEYKQILPSSLRLFRILSFTFIIHICLSPTDAFSAGFMLSYAALIGITLSENILKPCLLRFFPICLSSSLSASVGALFCTGPITIYLFGCIMPIGIISTIIVSPLIFVFLVFGLISVVLSLIIPFILYPIGDILSVLYRVIESVVLWFSQFEPIQF